MAARRRPPAFKIELPGDETKKTNFMEKVQCARNILLNSLNKPVNNMDIFEAALDNFIEFQGRDIDQDRMVGTYSEVSRDNTEMDLYVCATSSTEQLMKVTESHARICKDNYKIVKTVYRGHVATHTLKCAKTELHGCVVSSSPYLPNKEFLVNHRIQHGFVCSGMLPVHYTRFATAAGIGCIARQKRKKMTEGLNASIKEEYDTSIEQAAIEETASYEDLSGGIDIMTDARHGWRKNARDSSIVAIGEQTHKVIHCITVTKGDDIVSQRHEKVGTDKIYEHFNEKGVNVKVHTHDRNLTINKMVKSMPNTTNQNDSWHGIKKVKKDLKLISSGPQYKRGKTWSEQLVDKDEPVATHIHWAIRNCEQDAGKLVERLNSIVPHYKGDHGKCHETSRCKVDANYEPSRTVITDPKAEKLLQDVIKKSVIYKSPEDYVLARDTSYVESFNNVMNIFQDKRIAFSDETYHTRAMLSVLHWNDNVDREYTSIYNPRDHRAPRRQQGKKNYKKLNYKYRKNIWSNYMNTIYRRRR